MKKEKKQVKNMTKVKFIINESFSGTKSRTDLFSEMVLSKIAAANFTPGKIGDIMQSPTVKS